MQGTKQLMQLMMGLMWEGTAVLSVPVKEEQQLSATGFKQWDKGPSNERELVRAIVAFLVLLGCLNKHHNIPFLKVGLEQQETLVLCPHEDIPRPTRGSNGHLSLDSLNQAWQKGVRMGVAD